MLICTIFDDDQIWLDSTSKEMLKTHDAEVNASYSKKKIIFKVFITNFFPLNERFCS
jgi:hypothetical protein